ncbi:uncharacterized protein LOC127289362 [Leptopilina boulardi]|uniref:uncharacterized protein LOC127289362 n=1 Tax=Leptopilina boulardi TaxID=63433 RepID=UPI0021F60483|nr:uncharacterized protein LOC127289362 [Leptopilina boulardi]
MYKRSNFLEVLLLLTITSSSILLFKNMNNYLKAVLLVVVVCDYISFTTAEKRLAFNKIYLNDFKELCKQQNKDFNRDLRAAHDLVADLYENRLSLEEGRDAINQEKIKDLVKEVLVCFDEEQKPNATELESIYQEMTIKLNGAIAIRKFLDANNSCLNREFSFCMNNVGRSPNKGDTLFHALPIIPSNEQCTTCQNMAQCIEKSIKETCSNRLMLAKEKINIFLTTQKCTRV